MSIKVFLKRVFDFIKRHKWSLLLIFTTLIIGGFFVWDSYTAKIEDAPKEQIVPKKKEPELFSAPFSGIKIEKEVLERRPIAVMIENHPDSRPQSGLNEADFIFEAIAEGGITRFLALYHSNEVKKEIGPVRSARSYFVEWADSYDALYAHVGGSAEALNLINRLNLSDLNQFSLGKYFWRDRTRYAPHNVYTTTAKLREAAKSKSYKTIKKDILGYTFKKDLNKEERPESQRFTVGFGGGYAPTYNYNQECNCYVRSLLGSVQRDRVTKKEIIAKNVIVVFSKTGSIRLRNTTYTTIETIGGGKALIYQDGKLIIGTWKRNLGMPIRFYDDFQNEVRLNVGTTWVEVVGIGTKVY